MTQKLKISDSTRYAVLRYEMTQNYCEPINFHNEKLTKVL
jgi:hypothetical protein